MNHSFLPTLLLALALLVTVGCKRDKEDLEPAEFPTISEVFIDEFSSGLEYSAFGGSKVTAFQVDPDVNYQGQASMRFEVPDAGDPAGAYAGGVFFTKVGRNLSEFDALTFWAKASKAGTIDEVGFGNDLGESKYRVSLHQLKVNSNWKKFVIPIPDSTKLTQERGMLFYTEAPENGLGYTFWIDEVKFEKLGTLARPRPAILEGQEQTVTAATGDKLTIGGFQMTVNLPSGVDQTTVIAPAYFEFSSSETSIATVNSAGEVTVLDAGDAEITAQVAGVEALGSLTITSSGAPMVPETPAPTPTVDPDSVISMYSNTYTDVTVDTWNTRWQGSTAEDEELQVDGDDIRRYKNLNFVGIEFSSSTIDATEMTHFHIDMWTPDATDLPAEFKVLLVDFGPNGTFDGGDDSEGGIIFTAPTVQTEQWVSLDIPISNFAGLANRANLAQLVLSSVDIPNVFIDNVYFYRDIASVVTTAPEEAAPTPTRAPGDVLSIFSDAYDNVADTDFDPDWGQATDATQIDIAGNNTLSYRGLNFQGIALGSNQNVSDMTHLHLDYWTANSIGLNVFLISPGPVETPYALPVPTTGWNSVDIPLSDFSPVDLMDIFQFKFDGNGDIYVDNIYFYKDSGGSPTPSAPAPMPTRDEADVISVFSDSYNNLAGTNLNPDWGQGTVVSEVDLSGNNTLLYTGLDFQGIELAMAENVSEMSHLHLDVWTANSSALNTFLISSGPVETPYALTVPTTGWASFDIPLSNFSPVDLMNLIQFKFDGNGDIYLDNIYFYKDSGGAPRPSDPAPTPTRDEADVISIFSDAYTNLMNTNFNPDWGQATVVTEEEIMGNNTLVYTGLNYQGIELEMSEDVSAMSHLHIDFWTANSSALNAFLISGGPVETPYALTVPTSGWASVDIPLTDFSPVNLMDLIQFKFDGDGDIFLDNIYFYKEDVVGGPTVPTVAAPAPTRDEADVISIFSDSYNNLMNTNFNPDWGQATVVSEIMVEGNNTLQYSGLNYQGIELEMSTNIAGMTHFHLDFWTENSTALNTFLISSGPVETPYALTVPTMGWASVDIALADFSPVDLMDLIQFKFDGNGDIFLDNIYFYKEAGGPTGPTEPAPDPTRDEADVISVFSDVYTDIAGTNFNPNWGQGTVVTEEQIMGNATLLYTGLDYQGMELGSAQDVSGMSHLHMNVWTANSSALNAFLISTGPVEAPSALNVPTSGWMTVEIPLGDFTGVNLMDIIQFKFDGNGDIYLDNIYFYKDNSGGTVPTMAAPTPTYDPADVLSIFSDAYDNVADTDFNPNWGQGTVVSQESINGNNTLLYSNLNYQGTQLAMNQDVTGMNFLHVDIWTDSSTALEVFLISPGPVETPYTLTVPTSGWLSVDIPLSDFSPVDLANVFQFKFVGDGNVYIDNLFFRK